jgi:hypothetical protein
VKNDLGRVKNSLDQLKCILIACLWIFWIWN